MGSGYIEHTHPPILTDKFHLIIRTTSLAFALFCNLEEWINMPAILIF